MMYTISCIVKKSMETSDLEKNMTSENMLASVGHNIQEKSTVIWNVANSLFGAYKPHE